jgi:hypothetical protein
MPVLYGAIVYLNSSTLPSDGLALAGHREVRAALLPKHKS